MKRLAPILFLLAFYSVLFRPIPCYAQDKHGNDPAPATPMPAGNDAANPWHWQQAEKAEPGYWWRWKIEKNAALADLNAQRARRGLKAYLEDPELTKAAQAAAEYRAARLMAGHTSNDFQFLPAGARSPAAGCAAWPADMGFGACCCFEHWTYAGAASVKGRDGKMYHHLFVR